MEPKSRPDFQLPPGFRFHPSDEELIIHYLKNKVTSSPLPASIIADIDLYKYNPWELPPKALFGEDEWFFFTPRDRKYPNGARPNRAAASGYWKATGTDKPILNSSGTASLGVKKALVFYKGRLPKGIKTDWFMHEYRLINDTMISWNPKRKGSMRLDDWVLCRVRQKSSIQRSTWEDQNGPAPTANGGCNYPNSSGSELQRTNPDPNLEMVNNFLYNDCPMLPYLIASQDFPFSNETSASTISFQSISTERSSPTAYNQDIYYLDNLFKPPKRNFVDFGNNPTRVLPSKRLIGGVGDDAAASFCATDQSVDSNFSPVQWNNPDTLLQYQELNQIAFEIDN